MDSLGWWQLISSSRHKLRLMLLLTLAIPELCKAERLKRLYDFRSNRIHDYRSGLTPDPAPWAFPIAGDDRSWIRAEAGAIVDPDSYATLSQELDGRLYWGQRVYLTGYMSWEGIANAGYATLFIRVILADGTTVAFDSVSQPQHRAKIMAEGTNCEQVLALAAVDVPGPADGEGCPNLNALPAFIQTGLLLRGGQGFAQVWGVAWEARPLARGDTERLGTPPWEPHPWVYITTST